MPWKLEIHISWNISHLGYWGSSPSPFIPHLESGLSDLHPALWVFGRPWECRVGL